MASPAQRSSMLLTMTLVACGPATRPALTDAQRVAISDSILTIARGFTEAANARDVGRIAAAYSSDPAFTWATDGNLLLITSDSLMSLYRGMYRGFSKMESTWDTLRVSVLDPDAAVLSGSLHFTVTDTAGKTMRQAGAVTYVFVRRAGTWQLLHGHASHRALTP